MRCTRTFLAIENVASAPAVTRHQLLSSTTWQPHLSSHHDAPPVTTHVASAHGVSCETPAPVIDKLQSMNKPPNKHFFVARLDFDLPARLLLPPSPPLFPPTDPNCGTCKMTKTICARCKHRPLKRVDGIPPPTSSGNFMTAHTTNLNLNDESRYDHWNALIVQDGYTYLLHVVILRKHT